MICRLRCGFDVGGKLCFYGLALFRLCLVLFARCGLRFGILCLFGFCGLMLIVFVIECYNSMVS